MTSTAKPADNTLSEETKTLFESLVASRRSVRAFLPKAVPQTMLEYLFELASHAPSNCNTQPWVAHVVSGQALNRLREALPSATMKGEFSMDFPYEGKYTGIYKVRQYDAANQLFTAMGIAREEKEKRGAAFLRNFSFFDAPHAVFLFMDGCFGVREAADLGMYAQTFMLACTALGLASCPQTSVSLHAGTVRNELGIAEHFKLLFGIAFGYENKAAAANQCRTPRAPLVENVVFYS